MVLTVVYLMSIVNYVTCSSLCFLVNLTRVESYLSKRCKLYTKDISYYFCEYREDYFIIFINHL